MSERESTKQPDVSLLPFLEAVDEVESEHQLAELIAEQTEATINGIVRSKLHVSLSPTDSSHHNQDALDIVSDIQSAVVSELRDLKSCQSCKTISNFRSYIASVTFNACHQHLRRKYPQRWQLKNKLRYLLSHQEGFGLRESQAGEWLCGHATGLHGGNPAPRGEVQRLLENRQMLDEDLHKSASVNERTSLVLLLAAIFDQLKAPVGLDDLVGLIAELRGIKDNVELVQTDESRIDNPHERSTACQPSVVTELEQYVRLQKLWAEICQLPLRHRAALLLNLKDRQGDSVIALFPIMRIATIRQIAEVLAFPLEDFARTWNELPWDDLTIARYLQLTRQQVINLRQSARARLVRRMKGF